MSQQETKNTTPFFNIAIPPNSNVTQCASQKVKTKAPNFKKFLEMYKARLEKEYSDGQDSERLEVMQAANPRYGPLGHVKPTF